LPLEEGLLGGAVVGSVIDHDDLVVGQCLRGQAVEEPAKQHPSIPHRNDHRHACNRHARETKTTPVASAPSYRLVIPGRRWRGHFLAEGE
jgi:hypothetical protein